MAEGLDGETIRMMSAHARENSIYLCFGMPERDTDGAVYISQILLGPDGAILAVHRKFFNEQSKNFQLGSCP
jgi:predicted amidohydrolase